MKMRKRKRRSLMVRMRLRIGLIKEIKRITRRRMKKRMHKRDTIKYLRRKPKNMLT